MTTQTMPKATIPLAQNLIPAPRLFTVDEYERMLEAGIIRSDEPVQLLDGVIVCMAPMLPPHMAGISRTNHGLRTVLPPTADIRIQGPIRLPPYGEPEPDLAIVRMRADFYVERHPEVEDVFLLIEVADSSVRRDRRAKIPRYAAALIPETWLVDLSGDRVLVYREPRDGRYTITLTLQRGDMLAPLAFPDIQLSVDELLGPRPARRLVRRS